ncbi:hypothetical protein C8J57DRAFT_1525102 [Mycena rebaudengoi]|nr:hypothetical protein C8J57DRAFT_1525102 [Mycena rebaudengoi]
MPKGLSNGVQIKYGTSIRRDSKPITRKLNKTGKQLAKKRATENSQIASLNFEQRQELMELDNGRKSQYQFMDIDYNDENDYEDLETVYGRFPPGEEGLLQSHAGGEAIFQQMFNDFKRSDSRVRTERTQISVNKWQAQLDLLVEAYLEFKAQGRPEMHETPTWPLSVLSFSEIGLRTFSHAVGATRSNQTLVRHGYLGSSPESPAIAFPIEFLEQFRQIHRVCPRYSFDALSKTLNNLHKVLSRFDAKSNLIETTPTSPILTPKIISAQTIYIDDDNDVGISREDWEMAG